MTDNVIVTNKKQKKTVAKTTHGHFAKGNSGGGRPKGKANPVTRMVDAFIAGELPDAMVLIKKAIANGDTDMALAFYKHSVPPTKSRSIGLPIKTIKTLEDITIAMDIISTSMFEGTISIDEGKGLADFLEVRRKIIETEDQERRIRTLEMMEDSRMVNHTSSAIKPISIEN